MIRAYVLAALMACGLARADGLSDLRAALSRAVGATPVRATVEARTTRKIGEGKDADEEIGRAAVMAEDGAAGLSIVHNKDLLARMDAELTAKARNPNARTPTLWALDELRVRDVTALTSAAPVLLRTIERAQFRGEKVAAHQGKAARMLTFEIPITALSARDRKYAKQYSAVFDVWVGADGTPLASRLHQSLSGRAFVVVSFDSDYREECTYGLAGDRLLALRRTTRSVASGAGERDERTVVSTLQLTP